MGSREESGEGFSVPQAMRIGRAQRKDSAVITFFSGEAHVVAAASYVLISQGFSKLTNKKESSKKGADNFTLRKAVEALKSII